MLCSLASVLASEMDTQMFMIGLCYFGTVLKMTRANETVKYEGKSRKFIVLGEISNYIFLFLDPHSWGGN